MDTASDPRPEGTAPGPVDSPAGVRWAEVDEAWTPDLTDRVRALARSAQAADGHPPFSDQTWVEARSPEAARRVRAVLAVQGPDESLLGAAVLVLPRPEDEDPAVLVELAVEPDHRCQGIGEALVARAERLLAETDAGAVRVEAWAHGSHPGAATLARRHDAAALRELLQLELTDAPAVDSPLQQLTQEQARLWDVTAPDGVRIRTFRPGQDEEGWVRANAAAFAEHPEQGELTVQDLQARQEEPWFDPQGLFLAVDADDEDHILGFHWTKVPQTAEGEPTEGEVYAVGVVPQAQGQGLGRLLTVVGVRHLQGLGLDAIRLYVDADNTPAVRLYRALGFTEASTDLLYVRD